MTFQGFDLVLGLGFRVSLGCRAWELLECIIRLGLLLRSPTLNTKPYKTTLNPTRIWGVLWLSSKKTFQSPEHRTLIKPLLLGLEGFGGFQVFWNPFHIRGLFRLVQQSLE